MSRLLSPERLTASQTDNGEDRRPSCVNWQHRDGLYKVVVVVVVVVVLKTTLPTVLYIPTMTDMYDKLRSFDGRLKAHPHEDRGCEVHAFSCGVSFQEPAVPSLSPFRFTAVVLSI